MTKKETNKLSKERLHFHVWLYMVIGLVAIFGGLILNKFDMAIFGALMLIFAELESIRLDIKT